MKVNSLPFSLVFLSSLMPMVGAFLDISVFHIPAALVLGALALTPGATRNYFTANNIWINRVIVLLAFLLIIQILTVRGFVILSTGGYVLTFAVAFYGLLLTETGIEPKTIVRGISLIYKFFIVCMIIELFITMLGGQSLLYELFYSEVVPGYKVNNGADIPRLLGLFQDAGGLNSVLLGSQIAGMLSLFATIWFMVIGKSRIKMVMKEPSRLWILLSFVMLLVTINGTVLLLFIVANIIYGLFINRKHRVLFFCIIGLLLVVLYWLISTGYLFARIANDVDYIRLDPDTIESLSNSGFLFEAQNMTPLDYYIFEFYTPIRLFMSADWADILIGVGAQYLRTTSNYQSGDFGFGASLLASGLVWMAAFVAIVFAICIPALRVAASESNERQQLWAVLGSVNGLITLLWLLSTVHYNQAFVNPGGSMLFGLHLALTMYCRKQFFESPDSVLMPGRISS